MSEWAGIDEFIAVASAGSFSRGASNLGMSATHVSRSIKLLETRVQAQLFHRTTRTVRLTDIGHDFFERCLRIAQDRDEAIALIGNGGEPQGQLRVTCSTAMGERFVAPILRGLAMRHPMLSVSIDLSNRLVDLTAEGYDLAVRTGQTSDTRLVSTRIASRSLLTCAAPSYLASAGVPKLVGDLARHDCIVGTSATWHFHSEAQDIAYRPTGRFRCNSGHAVVQACIAGMGICQLPEFYILPYLEKGLVELLLQDAQPTDEPIWAVYPRRQHLLPKTQVAVDCLKQDLASALHERSRPDHFDKRARTRQVVKTLDP